ncbi:MAG: hypothetical protein MJZ29_08175 [Bacteroidaceae bacterium]|nr:hypothetical protein [Bacteroidaceae bacterium]
MRKILYSLIAAFSFVAIASNAQNKEASISIDSRKQFQHVTGFGGFSPSPTWSYWLGNTEMDKLFGKDENQLGLNILRTYIGNSKSSWSAGVANVKRAKMYGAFVFGSPWSPPASWKSNNSDSNGGELLTSRYKDWAVFLNDYAEYMKQQGTSIDAVSIQNEPDWNATYQSCIWTGEKLANFLKNYGNLIKCKIIAPEAIHFTRSMHEPILNDPAACDELDILGGHFYGWDGSSYPLAAQKGKEVWMTEFLINERQEKDKKDINWKDDGFLFAKSINDAMLANMSAWVHYSLKRYYGCLGDGNYGTVNNEITKRGYILSHYAKYVSGTTRISHALTDNSGKLSSSAYLSQTGDSVVVMVINSGSYTYNTTLTLPFFTKGGSQIVTTETANMVKTDITCAEETYEPTVEIQPYSVNTFIYKKSSERTDLVTEVEGSSVFTDGFDIAGASCIPPGWCSYSEEGLRSAGNYSLGPRIMSFSPEGKMAYAFYFRSGNNGTGYVSYGSEQNYRLQLSPGKYTLSFSIAGWKATPSVTAIIQKVRGKVTEEVFTPTAIVSSNGSSARITETNDEKVSFEITEQTNYILKWELQKTNGGFNEALLGNVKLVKHDEETGIDTPINLAEPSDAAIFDLSGRRVAYPSAPGIYIRGGKKIVVK